MSMGQSHLFLIENLTRIHLGFQTHVILLTSLISVAKFDLADQSKEYPEYVGHFLLEFLIKR